MRGYKDVTEGGGVGKTAARQIVDERGFVAYACILKDENTEGQK